MASEVQQEVHMKSIHETLKNTNSYSFSVQDIKEQIKQYHEETISHIQNMELSTEKMT